MTPAQWKALVEAVVIAAVVLTGYLLAAYYWGCWTKEKTRHADYVALAERAAREGSERERGIELARQGAIGSAVALADELRRRAAADRARAVRADDGVLHAFRSAGHCQAGGDPGAAEGGQDAEAADDLRADVFGRTVVAAREIAEFADDAAASLAACQLAYDGVRAAGRSQVGWLGSGARFQGVNVESQPAQKPGWDFGLGGSVSP